MVDVKSDAKAALAAVMTGTHTPDGRSVAMSLATRKAQREHRLGSHPERLVFEPDGQTLRTAARRVALANSYKDLEKAVRANLPAS